MKTPGHKTQADPPARKTIYLQIQGKVRRIDLAPALADDEWQVVLDGKSLQANARLLQPGVLSLILNGRTFRCLLDKDPDFTTVTVDQQHFSVEIHDPRSLATRRQKRGIDGGEQTIKAPMPGRIVRILVEPGQEVAAHQPVLAIEAMKMQNELKAVRPGKVREVRVSVGQTVIATQILVVIA